MKQGVKVKLNPFLFAIPSISDPPGCSSWYEMLESTLSTFPPRFFNKSLAKSCKRQRAAPFQGWGWNLQGFFYMWAWQMENVSEGSLHKWRPRTPCVNALGKCKRKNHLGLLLENCLIPYLSEHMTWLFILTTARGKPRSHNSINTGYTWAPGVAHCRPCLTARSDSTLPPAQETHWNTIKSWFLIPVCCTYNMGAGAAPRYTYSVIFPTVWNVSSSASDFLLNQNLTKDMTIILMISYKLRIAFTTDQPNFSQDK